MIGALADLLASRTLYAPEQWQDVVDRVGGEARARGLVEDSAQPLEDFTPELLLLSDAQHPQHDTRPWAVTPPN